MNRQELQARLKKGKVKIVIAGSEAEFREWLQKEGKSEGEYFYPDDEDTMQLLRVSQVAEILKVGDHHENPLSGCSKIKILEAELKDWKAMFPA